MADAPKTAKHTLTLQAPIYEALKRSAAKRGLDVNTHMQNVLTDHVIDDDTLDAETRAQIELGRSLIDRAVETAKQRCRDGLFARTITLDTFQACTADPKWAADYKTYVGADIFKHGNPLKRINREIGFRIRAAIGGEVEKDDTGAAVNAKVLGEVIQSYTPMKAFDPKIVG